MYVLPEATGGPLDLMTARIYLSRALLEGDVESCHHIGQAGCALESAQRSGEQVFVDLSGVRFMGAGVLHELLAAGRRSGQQPWICGPLGPNAERLLHATGTVDAFEVFPHAPGRGSRRTFLTPVPIT
ncbi:hypothetical protein [Streptomyces sp. NPDC059759]|uniref:hypothetical protein n=1 Tax=Streptomyces sp. NPDC059759 TaxID=3346936 RepID=UPI003657BCC8